jgi:hypothetical protein
MSKNATCIDLASTRTIPMHTSYVVWMTLCSSFFWFACAALVPVRKIESALSFPVSQIANVVTRAVAAAMRAAMHLATENQNPMQHR